MSDTNLQFLRAGQYPRLQVGVDALPVGRPIYVFGAAFSTALWFFAVTSVMSPEVLRRSAASLGIAAPKPDDLVGLLAVAAIAYAINSFAASTLKYLWNLNPVEDVVSFIRRLRATPPELGFNCQCYHFETRTRYVTEYYTEYEQQYDYNTKSNRTVSVQKSRQKLETYEEKVVTYNGHQAFAYANWDDVSAELTNEIYDYQATRVDLGFRVDFGDPEIEARYNAEKDEFCRRNRSRDTHFDFSTYCNVPGFKSKILSIVDLTKKSRWMHWLPYVLTTLAGFSWPYRRWFDRKTVHGAYGLRKRIFSA